MATSSGTHTDKLRTLSRELAACFQRGEEPSLTDWQERHPELAGELPRLFQATVHVRAKRAFAQTDKISPAAGSSKPLRHLGDYDIVREIGRGGMGVVYEAQQRSLGRRVALKVLPLHVAQEQHALDRFRREARSAAQLHHTNIVPVFEVGQEGDVCYYVMQFIHGISLEQDAIRQRHEPLPFPDHERRVAKLGEDVAHALAYAHARGIVHRDIKPANLLLDNSGTVWITDFGLAKGSGDNLTATGDILGTLCFMAPERFKGQGDHRADIYALGLTLYEILLQRPAYPASDRVHLLELVQSSEPERPRTVEPRLARDLETIIVKAIDKDPARRYETAAAMAEDLRRFLADEPIRARPAGPVEKVVRAARRNPRLALLMALVGGLVLTLIGGSIFAAISFRQLADDQRREADAARRAEHVAKTAQDKAESEQARANDKADAAHEISTFLLGLLGEADPLMLSRRGLGQKPGEQHMSPLEMLNLAAERLKTTFRDRPAMRADLLDKVGAVYVSFGQFTRARPLIEEGLALRRNIYGDDHLKLAESWHNLGYLHHSQLDPSEAVRAYERALAIRTTLLDPDHPLIAESLIHLGFAKGQVPGTTDGEALLRRAMQIQAKHHTRNSREYGVALVALFQYYFHRSENIKLLLLAHETDKLVKDGIGSRNKLALAINTFIQGQAEKRKHKPNYARVAELYERALELGEPLIGKSHYFLLLGRKELAFTYMENMQRPDLAARQFQIAHNRLMLMSEDQSSEAAYVLLHWGRCLRDQRKYAEAEPLFRQAIAILRKEKGDLGRTLHCLAEVLFRDNRLQEVEPVLAETVQVRKARSDGDKLAYGSAVDFYTDILLHHKKTEQAIASLREHLPELDLHADPDAHHHFRQAARRGLLCVLLGEKSSEVRQAELARAMAGLQRALDAGFRDDHALRTDPRLGPLRALPEFAKLVEKK